MCPRPLLRRDASALIGLLATLEGHLTAGPLDEAAGDRLRRRLAEDGLLPDPGTERQFRQALNDLNQRVRYALGEYDTAPTPRPVSP